MEFNILSFALGLAVVAFFSHLPPLIEAGGVFFFFVFLSVIFYKSTYFKKILFLISFFCLGIVWNDYLSLQWQKHKINQPIEADLVGKIINLPVDHLYYTNFEFKTEKIDGKNENRHLLLSWQKPHPPLAVNDRWQFYAHLKPPHGLINFGPFNRLRNLWAKDVHGTGYILSKKPLAKISQDNFWQFLPRWRQNLQEEISENIPDHTQAALITALTIGVEQGLSTTDWQVLRNTGTVHLVVIAGLHIGMMVAGAYFFTNLLWRRFPKLVVRYPAQHASAWVALLFAGLYGGLAGFGIPTQRAVVMVVILMLNQLFYREWTVWRRLSLAFLGVIVIEPGALFTAGFWLSFGAVFWIAYALSAEWRKKPKWRQWLRLQLALFLGLMPLTLYFFQQFSWISLLANLPAVPWIGWVVVPLCLLAALMSVVYLPFSQLIFKFAAFLTVPLWRYLSWLSQCNFAVWHYPLTQFWILVSVLLGVGWILAPPLFRGRWLGWVGFLPLLLIHPPHPQPGEVWLTVLDVGQGLATVVQTSNHTLIYDTGPHIKDGFDAGDEIVSPYLQLLGIKIIDTLVVSHGDNDHSGGAAAILTHWPVKKFLTSIPSMFPDYKPGFCAAEEKWEWDDIPFKMLGPPPGTPYEDNNSSCILKIGNPGAEILLVGDIEAKAEKWLVDQYGKQLQARVLVVPHHGSRTSSSASFLAEVHPEYALFSLGFQNRFHFPAPSVIKRYQKLPALIVLTAQSGAIHLKLSPQKPVKVEVANPHHYFWQK